jgi:hypothetical protein
MDAANSELSDLKKQISVARVEERKASVALGQADALVKNLQVIFHPWKMLIKGYFLGFRV